MAPRKRDPQSLTTVLEPPVSSAQFDAWHEGIELFNNGDYWEAHEQWEAVWLGMGDDGRDDAEIVVRGFIQLTAGLHLIAIGRLDGARSNLEKAAAKLALAPPSFLGIDVVPIRNLIPVQLTVLPAMVRFQLQSKQPLH